MAESKSTSPRGVHPERRVLASDMDGTFLPPRHEPAFFEALAAIRAHLEAEPAAQLAFITGRRFDSVQEAIAQFPAPVPDWIICDVGTSIYERTGNEWTPRRDYAAQLQALVGDWNRDRIFAFVEPLEGIWPQDPVHQQEFKASFKTAGEALEAVAEDLETRLAAEQAPLSVVSCHDIETQEGMIDLLPTGVSKAYALEWLIEAGVFARDRVIFAGDSGNDLAGFLSGIRSIIVGNAPAWIHEQARAHAAAHGRAELIYSARGEATVGLVEGLRHFRWMP